MEPTSKMFSSSFDNNNKIKGDIRTDNNFQKTMLLALFVTSGRGKEKHINNIH